MSNHYHYNYHAHHRAAPQLQSSQEIRAENNGLYEDIEVDDYDDDEDNDDYHDMPEPDEDDEDDDNDDDADTDTNDNSVQRKRKKKDGVCVVVEVYWNGPGPAKSKKAVTSIYTDWSVSDIHDELASVLLKEQLPASLEQFRVSYVYKTEYADNIDDEDDREKKPKRRKKGKKPKAKTKRKSRSVQEISVYHYDFAKVEVERIDHLVMRQMPMYTIKPVVPLPNTTATAHRNITRNSVQIKGMRQASMALRNLIGPSEFDKLSKDAKYRDIYASAKCKLGMDGCTADEVKWWVKYAMLQIDQQQQGSNQQQSQSVGASDNALTNITNLVALKLLKELSTESKDENEANAASTSSASTTSSHWQSTSPIQQAHQQPSSYTGSRAPNQRPVSNQRYNPMS